MGLFGPPKITLMLEKYNFNPGDVAKGTITINLKKPTYARKLLVSLIGTRKVRKGNSTSWQKVYDFDMPISGEKEYQKENLNFELQIPPNILEAKTQQQAVQNALEDKLGSAGSLIGAMAVGRGTTKWKIRVQLDVPKAFDVKADQDIQLYESQGKKPGNI